MIASGAALAEPPSRCLPAAGGASICEARHGVVDYETATDRRGVVLTLKMIAPLKAAQSQLGQFGPGFMTVLPAMKPDDRGALFTRLLAGARQGARELAGGYDWQSRIEGGQLVVTARRL